MSDPLIEAVTDCRIRIQTIQQALGIISPQEIVKDVVARVQHGGLAERIQEKGRRFESAADDHALRQKMEEVLKTWRHNATVAQAFADERGDDAENWKAQASTFQCCIAAVELCLHPPTTV